jgi:parallel beta-helix repeat protein
VTKFTTIQRNSFVSNTEAGIELTLDSSENLITANDFLDNAGAIELAGENVGDHTVSRNRIDGSREDGIFVNAPNGTIRLERNVLTGGDDDGIDVDTPGAVITKNRANFNADLGIEAVPGVTDGGGNKARGNGNPAQCLNVQCK